MSDSDERDFQTGNPGDLEEVPLDDRGAGGAPRESEPLPLAAPEGSPDSYRTEGYRSDYGDPSPDRQGLRLALILLVLAAVAIAGWWFFLREPPAPATSDLERPAVSPAPAAEVAEEPEEPAVDLPTLADSDPFLRERLAGLSSDPELSRWLGQEDLLRRAAAAADNVAEGVDPASHLGFLRPKKSFTTIERDGDLYIDPASYRRYDTLTTAVTSVDPQAAARLYRLIRPLASTAYRELGYPDRSFDDTLNRALRQLLATPVIQGDAELVPRVLGYGYADPELEALAPAQKQLLRTGPDNARRLQAHLRAFQAALGN